MSARHARPVLCFWRRRRRPPLPHRERAQRESIAQQRGELLAALRERGLLADVYGTDGVTATHPTTGRMLIVVLRPDDDGRLVWYRHWTSEPVLPGAQTTGEVAAAVAEWLGRS